MKPINQFDVDRLTDAAYRRGVHEAMILAEESFHNADKKHKRRANTNNDPGLVLIKLRSAAGRARINPQLQSSGFKICKMLGILQ